MTIPGAVQTLDRDLRGIFGGRFQSLVLYGQRSRAAHDGAHQGHGSGHDDPPAQTLAIVESMTESDLRASAEKIAAWHDAGLATPLLIVAREFVRSLDAFPLEFGAILADHEVVSGNNPFASLAVDPADVRRACEVQARSHLLHLREGYLETRGRADALSDLIVRSAAAFAALIASIARLDGHQAGDPAAAARHVERILNVPGSVSEITKLASGSEIGSAEAVRLFGPYLAAVEKLVDHVDGWSGR
jgi:hypothetical protein